MKDAIELNQLSQKLDIHLENAKKYEASGQFSLAKRNYLLSAEVLMQMAKLSSPKLAEAKMERARKFIKYADSLGTDKKPQKNLASKENGEDGEANEFASAQIPNVHFSDIAGLEDVKEAIRVRMIYPLKHKDLYSAYNKKMGGGVLLFGPPGTGKTMIAKAIACEVGAVFYAVKGSDIMSKYVGESEKNINALFETARKNELSIIFIDEIDSILKKRGEDAHNDKRVNEFLQQIDGFASNSSNLLLLGATNRPWDIDSAAMRSGRFSEKIYVPLPDKKARRFLFNKYLENTPLDYDCDIDKLVEMSEGLSGADINEVCDNAKIGPLKASIISREKYNDTELKKISFADFERAFSKVKSSVTAEELKKLDEFASNFNMDIKASPEISNDELGFASATKAEPQKPEYHEPVKQEQSNKLDIVLGSDIIKILPNTKASFEFFINGDYSKVYAKIGTTNFVCKKNIRNWIIDNIDLPEGEYEVEIKADNKFDGKFNIKLIKGIVEQDYDL